MIRKNSGLEEILDRWRQRQICTWRLFRTLNINEQAFRYERIGKHKHLILLDDQGGVLKAVIQNPYKGKSIGKFLSLLGMRFHQSFRTLEFVGVSLALVAFFYDFWIEKPRERAIEAATLTAQLAQLGISDDENTPAKLAILKALIVGKAAIQGMNIQNVVIVNESFDNQRIQGSKFHSVIFRETTFDHAIIMESSFAKSSFQNTSFTNVHIEGNEYPFNEALQHALKTLDDYQVTDDEYQYAQLASKLFKDRRGVDFSKTYFRRVTFKDARITDVDFSGATFFASDFAGAKIERANFNSVVFLEDYDADNPVPSTENADFVNVDFRGADFSGLRGDKLGNFNFIRCLFDQKTRFPKGYQLPSNSGAVLN